MAVMLLPPGEAHPGNPRWHELRRGGVTASEVPVILGLSTWDSPWSLWHRKRGLIDDEPGGESADWGRRLEGGIAAAAADRLDPHENLCFEPAGLYARDGHQWQMATPDRLVLGTEGERLALLEVKHPYSWDGWGDDGTDDIPPAYAAQCLWQLDVMDLDECWLAAYTRHSMRCYTIRRSAEAEEDLAMMRQQAWEFLAREDPPPLDAHPATLAAVKALHPDLEDREQEVMHEVAHAYRQACRDLDAATARKREAESALRIAMGSARRAITLADGPASVATRSVYERRTLDSAGLRRDHPDIADRYTSTTTVDRLTPARKDTDDQDQ